MPSQEPKESVPQRPSTHRPVALADIADHVQADSSPGDVSVQITGVAQASGRVHPGDLYVARPGGRTHGAHYLADAEAAGAVAWMTDPEGARIGASSRLPLLVVDNPGRVLGSTAALVYGHPAERLSVIGVTGTQGKTTATRLIEMGLAAAGVEAAVIGTMGTSIGGRPVASDLTTPEAPDLHAMFAVMVEEGVEVCAMEVSSHALAIGRVDGVVFDLAVFTNFGRDHLDFHLTVDDYFAAKADLFTPARARRGLLNADDPAVIQLLDAAEIPVRTFSTSGADADWTAHDITVTANGSQMVVSGPDVEVRGSVNLPGSFNVANALVALAAIGEVGRDVRTAARGIAALEGVAGRMERIDRGQDFQVIVDYAHKPDAMTAALEAMRPVTQGRLIIVIGAGGNRDVGKRPLMGQVAAALADVVVVTDDNPRAEDPAEIRRQIIAGTVDVPYAARVMEIGDRATAITTALRGARADDTVIIAGKGHETGQEIGGSIYPFDDRIVVAATLESLTGQDGSS